MDQACVMLADAKRVMSHLAGAWNVRPAVLMLGALAALNARGQKTFLLKSVLLYRHSSRGPSQRHGTRCAWPGERGPAFRGKRLFSITANYITVRWPVRNNPECVLMLRWHPCVISKK